MWNSTGRLSISPSLACPSNDSPSASARNPLAVRCPNPREPKCTPIHTQPSSSSKRST